jgi:beta-lactamase regulating signal transducer with metallopeptidase domain
MTTLGLSMVCLAVRVTVVALLAAALAGWSARRAARCAVIVLATAMTLFLALSVAALCPAPDLGRWSPRFSTPASDATRAGKTAAEAATARDAPVAGLSVAAAWRLLRNLSSQAPQSPAWQHSGTMVAGLYGAGVALAGLRLLSSWLAVRSLRRSGRPIHDVDLRQLADSLRLVIGCSRHVDLKECREPGLAATVGWWRPVILLPPEWPEWTEMERKAVLAHELAHIYHGDYPIGLATRLCRVLYFYHPLVRWLSTQLRWQQELAADDLAASAVADRGLYLKALASLALRSPTRMSAGAMPWSAMTGGTLLRRIHMLRGTEKSRPLGWMQRDLVIGLLVGAGLLLATLGSPATPPDPPREGIPPFEIGYLAPDAKGFIAIRPAFLFAQPGMDKVKQAIASSLQELQKLGITWPDGLQPENIEEIVANVHFGSNGTGKTGSRQLMLGSSSVFIRLNRDFDWPAFFKSLSKQVKALTKSDLEITEICGDVTIYRLGGLPMLGAVPVFYMPDRRSVVFRGLQQAGDVSRSAEALRELVRNVAAARRRDWGSGYDKVARAPIAAVMDNRDQHYAKLFAKDLDAGQLRIVENLRFATLGIEVGAGRPVRLLLDATSAAAAMDLETAVDGVFRAIVDEVQKPRSDSERDVPKLVAELWQSRTVKRTGAQLEWLGYSSVRLQQLWFPANENPAKEPPKRKPD